LSGHILFGARSLLLAGSYFSEVNVLSGDML
jgi:hypothetical protein